MLVLPPTAQLRSATKTKPESIVIFEHVIVALIWIGNFLAFAALLVNSARFQGLSEFGTFDGFGDMRTTRHRLIV